MNDLHYIVRTEGTCLSECPHEEKHDPCITGSFMIAKPFETYAEAEGERKLLAERWPHVDWMIAIQEPARRETMHFTL